MALTCRTFHGPANEVLWEELPGLRPLLKLLPEDAYRIPNEHDSCDDGSGSETPGVLVCPNTATTLRVALTQTSL